MYNMMYGKPCFIIEIIFASGQLGATIMYDAGEKITIEINEITLSISKMCRIFLIYTYILLER